VSEEANSPELAAVDDSVISTVVGGGGIIIIVISILDKVNITLQKYVRHITAVNSFQ
jgi:hypothetical protein